MSGVPPTTPPPGAVRSMLSGRDNVSLDVMRVLALAIGLGLIGFTGWSMWQGHDFSAAAYCGGAAVLLPALGAGLRWKAPTEPEPK